MTTRLWRGLYILAWLVAGGVGAALLGAAAWPDDLSNDAGWFVLLSWLAFMATVFKLHLGLGSLALGVLGLFAARALRRRAWVLAGAVAFAAFLGAGPAAVSWLPRRAAPATGGDTVTVMSANLLYGRADAAALLRQVESAGVDVVLFQEYTPAAAVVWRPLLEAEFPHRVEHARDDAFGQAVFSRRPFVGSARVFPPEGGWTEPQICVQVDVGGRATAIVNVHVWPPASPDLVREHRRQAERIASWGGALAREFGACVMAGDFNATPGTAHLRAVEGAGFRESFEVAGRGRGTTWPRGSVLSAAPGIRLDHVFFAGDMACTGAWCGEDTGSDHRPVFARLSR